MVQRIYESDQNTLAELQKEYEALQKKLNELEDAKDELTAVQGALQEEPLHRNAGYQPGARKREGLSKLMGRLPF